MPVLVTITVADPPAAPPGYALCAFEVRGLAGGTCAALPGTTDGFEDAAHVLAQAVTGSLARVGVGFRLAAVAWWAERPLHECKDGCERLVSVYDAGRERWGAWAPEERVTGSVRVVSKRDHRAVRQCSAQSKALGTGYRGA